MRYSTLLGFFVLCIVGCSKSRQAEPPPRANATTVSVITPGGTITGTLREQIPVDPYVYVRLATASGELWAAVNQAPLTVGSSVTVYNALPMEQFASKTLNRTFERIYFGALEPSRGMASDGPADAGSPSASTASGGTLPAPDAEVGPIARARGADARTIGELWTQKSHLAGATVTIRGVVVKYNAGVMGKNWIHLQDGSGDSARGTHDIAVTSLDEAAVGDTVTITGMVRTNRDVGAGYTFAVIVEEAKVTGR